MSDGALRIDLVRGDIAEQAVDVVVNAANSSLLGGSGVDGAIHRVGGPAVTEACREIRRHHWPEGLPAGRAVLTTAGNLPARWVAHAVGPVFAHEPDRAVLAGCYREALSLAAEQHASSIAFPAIGAGAYGWPAPVAAEVALEACIQAALPMMTVRFALWSTDIFEAFRDAAKRLGGREETTPDTRPGDRERWAFG